MFFLLDDRDGTPVGDHFSNSGIWGFWFAKRLVLGKKSLFSKRTKKVAAD